VVAGGTDLLLELQQGRRPPVEALVDVTRIGEMTRIEETGGTIVVGAAVSHAAIVESPLLAQKATCLVESCGVIGGPQVRNVATLGGNVAHGLPAGDGTLSLVALDAEAEIAGRMTNDAGRTRREWRSVLALFKGPGESSVDQTRELLVRFRFKAAGQGEATAFKRIMRPQGVALPIINLAIRISRDGETVTEIRIAVGPGASIPWREEQAEQALLTKPFSAESVDAAQEALLAHVGFRSSPRRASAEYRRHLVGTLFRETLSAAWQRAK